VSGTDTGTTVLDWLVGQAELAQVVTDHLSLDFDLVERLAVVHGDDAAHHLGQDDRVAQMRLDDSGLLERGRLLLGLAQTLEQSLVLVLETASEASASTAVHHHHKLVIALVKKSVQVNATVSEFTEDTLLLELESLLD